MATSLPQMVKGFGKGVALSAGALLAYTVVGYPAVSVGLAGLLPARRRHHSDRLPTIAVVIPAHNEAAVIEAKVRNVMDLDYPDNLLSCVIVDDGSADGTGDIAQRAIDAHGGSSRIRLVRQTPRAGKMTALQRAIDSSDSELVAFSDAECLWPESTLYDLLPYLADPGVGAVNGRFEILAAGDDVSSNESLYLRYESVLKQSEARIGSIVGVYGGCILARREAVPTLPPDIINDDFFLAMVLPKRGYRVEFAPEVVVREYPAESLSDDYARRRRMLRGRVQSLQRWREFLPMNNPVVMWQVISHKYLRLALPLTLAATAGGALLWALATPRARFSQLVLTGQAALAFAAFAGPHLPKQLSVINKVGSPVRYIGNYATAAVGAMSDMWAADNQGHLWTRVTKTATSAAPAVVDVAAAERAGAHR